MKTRLSIGVVSLALGTLFSAPAVADEVWLLPSGDQLIYDRDVGDVAVLTYRAEPGLAPEQIFVVGLGEEYEGRYHYQGYWVEAGPSARPRSWTLKAALGVDGAV